MASERSEIEMDIFHNGQEIDSDSSRSRSSDESNSDSDAEEETARDIQDYYAVHDIPRCKTFAGMGIVEFFDRDKIKVGLRVVRGTDWDKGDEDGGEGNVGTVVEILNNSQQVRVQWDSQDTLDAQKNGDIFNYKTGMDMKYDLRLFDNAQTGAHHKFFACDVCDEAPIRGMRWRCLYCEDYDLCTDCYMNDSHNLDHAFERYQGMKTMSVNVGTRADSQDWMASGIFSGYPVKSRKDPTVTGTVEAIDDNIATLYNCDAKVTWEGDIKKRYRVGREGKVDIRFTEPAKMKYFQDHLQEISKVNAAIGIKVVKRSDKDHVIVGTITSVKEIKTEGKELKRRRRRSTQRKSAPLLKERGSFNLHQKNQTEENSVQHCSLTVQWDDGETDENVQTSEREILLFDNSQIGTKQGAMCDGCATGYRIKGIRWKCDECSNYDLCTSCYMSAKDGHIDHKFQRITEPAERKKMETSRTNPEVKVKTALGIFKGATVQELESNTDIDLFVFCAWGP